MKIMMKMFIIDNMMRMWVGKKRNKEEGKENRR